MSFGIMPSLGQRAKSTSPSSAPDNDKFAGTEAARPPSPPITSPLINPVQDLNNLSAKDIGEQKPDHGHAHEGSSQPSHSLYQTRSTTSSAIDNITDSSHLSTFPPLGFADTHFPPSLVYDDELRVLPGFDRGMNAEEGQSATPNTMDSFSENNDPVLSSQDIIQDAGGEQLHPTTPDTLSSSADSRSQTRRKRRMSAPPLSRLPAPESESPWKYPFAIARNAPAKLQLLNWLQHWAVTAATHIQDPQIRHEQNVIIGKSMENIWIEAMRMGLVPADWQSEDFLEGAHIPTIQIDITAADYDSDRRGRSTQESQKRRRPLSPNREVAIDTRDHKNARHLGITVGELAEANITMEQIRLRIENGNVSSDGEQLLQDTVTALDQDRLYETNWKVNLPRTPYNQYGRDLQIYALWEAQRAELLIDYLRGLIPGFKSYSQVRNTEQRIANEQTLLEQLYALALIMYDRQQHEDESSESDIEEVDGEVEAEVDPDDVITVSDDEEEPQTENMFEQDVEQEISQGDGFMLSGTKPISQLQLGDTQYDSHFTLPDDADTAEASTLEPPLVDEEMPSYENNLKRPLEHADEDVMVEEPPAKKHRSADDEVVYPPAPEPVHDIEGYPTRQQIFNAFPPEGLPFDDFQEHFDNKYSKYDRTWHKLIGSVAKYDKASQRFFRIDSLTEELGYRKVITLKWNPDIFPGYRPEDFSTKIVNNTSGFCWRYLEGTSPQEREAMDNVIQDYVTTTKRILPIAQAPRKKEPGKLIYDYHGRYTTLVDPSKYLPGLDGRYRFPSEPKPIVHGIWELRGRKNEDKSVPGMEWFYAGLPFDAGPVDYSKGIPNGEMVKTYVARNEPCYYADGQGPSGEVTRRELEIEGMGTEDQAAGLHMPVHLRAGYGGEKSVVGKKLKLKIDSTSTATEHSEGSGGEGKSTVKAGKKHGKSQGKSEASGYAKAAVTRSAVNASNVKGKGKAARGRGGAKVKGERETPRSVRAARARAGVKGYKEDEWSGGDGSDEEYVDGR
jgi:hypothetical protein